jgi:hypothetical protein
MKNKNLILGLVAFVFAIGSAFSSDDMALALVDVYVRAQIVEDGVFTCQHTNAQCDPTGTVQCMVSLSIAKPAGPSPKTVNGRDMNCALLHHSSSTVIPTALTIGVVPWDVN